MKNMRVVTTVNTAMPELRHLFETRRGHPRELFVAMLSLAGALTAFSAVTHPRDLPAFAVKSIQSVAERCLAAPEG